MPLITATEVFYSRVEAPYSPRNRNGYQVVYSSPSLSDKIVREVEDNIRCFTASEVDTRYQYFHLTSGQVALTASREIEDVDTRITDRAGRSGPFVGHGLVLSMDDFRLLENDPFLIFDTEDAFVLDVPTMIETQQNKIVQREILVEMPEIEVTDNISYTDFDVEGWKRDEFVRMWHAAANAQTLAENKQAVTIQGDSDSEISIYELLRLIIKQLSPEQRYYCTFNTFTDGCQPQIGTFWAVGGFRRIQVTNYAGIRLDRRTVNYHSYPSNPSVEALANEVFTQLRNAQGLDEADD